ncbi:MAG: D-lyxose/D-mannose family sugar isomerase [Spirochaetaceae bacterium]|nr:MAG: D-lyxose/D-mannose family sugar isomerase [Spirochaetaceae bacterium]
MKRSQINRYIQETEEFFASFGFKLPPWAHWSITDWKRQSGDITEIIDRGLGWDITDFGLGTFAAKGLVLFTIRNGKLEKGSKPYAEKLMLVGEEQETPFHYHWTKIEDIINRGGGTLVLELAWEDADRVLSDRDIEVSIDGIRRPYAARETVELSPGESITLPTGLYHRFWGKRGGGPVMTGEVSMVNDDAGDNKFLDPIGRFPDIEEDDEPYRLLASDYAQWITA